MCSDWKQRTRQSTCFKPGEPHLICQQLSASLQFSYLIQYYPMHFSQIISGQVVFNQFLKYSVRFNQGLSSKILVARMFPASLNLYIFYHQIIYLSTQDCIHTVKDTVNSQFSMLMTSSTCMDIKDSMKKIRGALNHKYNSVTYASKSCCWSV